MWLNAIWRYPLKSMAGERVEAARLGHLGVPDDRVAYVVDELGATISARTRPKLLGLRGGTGDGDAPTVNGVPWDSPAAAEWVRAAAGPGARLVRARAFERFDILPLLVATDGAINESGLDVRRLRPNLVIGGVDGLAERTWEGRYLRIGEAVVGLATLRERCIVTTYEPDTLEQDVGVLLDIRRRLAGSLALNAWVASPGMVRVGDPVGLLESFDEALTPRLGTLRRHGVGRRWGRASGLDACFAAELRPRDGQPALLGLVLALLWASRVASVATTRADGRPHVSPIWMVEPERTLWFWMPRTTVTGRPCARPEDRGACRGGRSRGDSRGCRDERRPDAARRRDLRQKLRRGPNSTAARSGPSTSSRRSRGRAISDRCSGARRGSRCRAPDRLRVSRRRVLPRTRSRSPEGRQ